MYGRYYGGYYYDNWFNSIILSMKKIILFALFLGMSLPEMRGEETDNRYQQIEKQISVLQQSNSRLNSNVRELTRQNLTRKADIDSLQALVKKQAEEIAELSSLQKSSIKKYDDQFEVTNGKVEQNESALGLRTTWGGIAACLLLIIIGIAVYFLRKRISVGSSAIDDVKSAQDKLQEAQIKLQEESIRLDDKLIEVLNKQLPSISVPSSSNGVPDHSLALKVADEIVRIETNLSRMDASIKGYKQLTKAVERIKDNFKANGYEIVDMIGKPYTAGMKAAVTFVTDENLSAGQQIITKVIKPQIDYQQQMIQAAQIEVSQPE